MVVIAVSTKMALEFSLSSPSPGEGAGTLENYLFLKIGLESRLVQQSKAHGHMNTPHYFHIPYF